MLKIRIKESKTDRLRAGAVATLPRTGLDVCPVKAVLKYMVVRGPGPGPFFKWKNGKGLSRTAFVKEVKLALEKGGFQSEGISGHSFRIGAATAAAESGVSEEVKALGWWRRREYRGYVHLEEGSQAAAAKKWAGKMKIEGTARQ